LAYPCIRPSRKSSLLSALDANRVEPFLKITVVPATLPLVTAFGSLGLIDIDKVIPSLIKITHHLSA